MCLAQGGGETVFNFFFCVRFLASLSNDLARVGVRLKLDVFMSSSLLIKGSEVEAKVHVRLELEGGLIERFYVIG